jgi:tetratricopeptide (TPR) repeat protein
LDIIINTYGEMHAETAVILNDLGTLFATTENWKRAAEHLERALIIHNAILSGGNNPEAAQILRNLSTVWEELQQYAKAKDCFQKSYQIFEGLFGGSHPESVESRRLFDSVSSTESASGH